MQRLIDTTPFSIDKLVIPDGTGSYMRGYYYGAKHVLDEMAAAPTVDAAPIVHGRWISQVSGNYGCSVCGDEWGSAVVLMKYCPCCGAKMDMKGDEKE